MINGYKRMRIAVYSNPHLLLSMPDKLKRIADSMLPVDTGIEIECTIKEDSRRGRTRDSIFASIENIVAVECDSAELRFRIPSGIKGMICLYDISEALIQHAELNPASGNHYHIDFTSHYDKVTETSSTRDRHLRKHNDWLIKAIKHWNYKGTYNSMLYTTHRSAIRLATEHKTIEYRIGEMTFDYELLIKRIINCQNITRRLKELVDKDI